MNYPVFILLVRLSQACKILCGKKKELLYLLKLLSTTFYSNHLYVLFSGHGTYAEDDSLKASVAGVMQKVNKLICIRPLKSRYVGEIGDVVVGRVLEVQQRRWKVETNSRLDSVLQLSSVNLPGGELVSISNFDNTIG